MAIGLLYKLHDMVKCVCYMSFGSNGSFMIGTALMGSHYRTNIISGVGHPKSDSVVLQVLCTVVYNGQATGIVLQVPQDSNNPAEKG